MDPFWIILPVVLVCAEVQSQLEVKAEPGQNATLTCSVNTSSVYWYIEVHSQVAVLLARTYSKRPGDSEYYAYNTTKYVAMGTALVIRNTTAEDCRYYYCARKLNASITVVNAIRLVSGVCTSSYTSSSAIGWLLQNELVIYASLALNALLVSVLIGVVLTCVRLRRRSCNRQLNDPSPLTYENPETLETAQYEEIQLRTPSPAAPPPECIYYKVQLPGVTPP